MDKFVLGVKKVISKEKLQAEDLVYTNIVLDNVNNTVLGHIDKYIAAMTPLSKTLLIQEGLANNISISKETINFECLSSICQEIIINYLQA